VSIYWQLSQTCGSKKRNIKFLRRVLLLRKKKKRFAANGKAFVFVAEFEIRPPGTNA
jgi:hypothetical protein